MTGLRLRLGLKAGAQGQVCAHVTEAVFPAVEGLLCGLPAGRAAQAVRRLHGLCRAAQGLCADLALAAATGTDMPASDLRAATGAAQVEIARETGLRLCLDWAALLGEAPQVEAARALMQVTREGQVPDPDGLVGWIAARGAEGLPARVLAAAPAELAPAFAARLETLAGIPARLAELAAGARCRRGGVLAPAMARHRWSARAGALSIRCGWSMARSWSTGSMRPARGALPPEGTRSPCWRPVATRARSTGRCRPSTLA
jgi:hypothetical protein